MDHLTYFITQAAYFIILTQMFFVYLVAAIPLHALVDDSSWLYSINLSLLGMYLHIVFHLVQLETSLPVIAH